MDNDNDISKTDFKVGDRVYCDKRKMHGFISRLNPLGCKKMFAVGVHWDNNQRDIIFGSVECNKIYINPKP